MRILIDTHVFLWALAAPARIAPPQREELERLANTIYVSSISIAEIMLKASLGKLTFNFDPVQCTEQMGFQPLNFTATDAVVLKELPFHHRDPFDRMLIAQGIAQKMTIMTSDRNFASYGCDLV
ncbi:MAG: type II toxin-antitoxin system VapC family toxin [Gammaproteobacteria bacterium]